MKARFTFTLKKKYYRRRVLIPSASIERMLSEYYSGRCAMGKALKLNIQRRRWTNINICNVLKIKDTKPCK